MAAVVHDGNEYPITTARVGVQYIKFESGWVVVRIVLQMATKGDKKSEEESREF